MEVQQSTAGVHTADPQRRSSLRSNYVQGCGNIYQWPLANTKWRPYEYKLKIKQCLICWIVFKSLGRRRQTWNVRQTFLQFNEEILKGHLTQMMVFTKHLAIWYFLIRWCRLSLILNKTKSVTLSWLFKYNIASSSFLHHIENVKSQKRFVLKGNPFLITNWNSHCWYFCGNVNNVNGLLHISLNYSTVFHVIATDLSFWRYCKW